MIDALGQNTILGYCTNVHGGNSLQEIKANLQTFAVAVKQRVSPKNPMGIGLWLSADVVNEIALHNNPEECVMEFRSWLNERGLMPYTLNGFPFHNFHEPVVKHAVYKPDWSHPLRLQYTENLATILHLLLPDKAVGSISTLPIGWDGEVGEGWSNHILDMVEFLADLEEQTGRLIHLDIEPEPGCEIGDTQTFFMLMTVLELMGGLPKDLVRRYLRVCHDVCHSAVMFEQPTKMLQWCRDSGFRIGKIQLSSAVQATFAGRSASEKSAMRAQLQQFVEPRYVHQTTVGTQDGHALKAFYDDLPIALKTRKASGYEWRVHFHVPVYLASFGHLGTTQDAITELMAAIKPEDDIHHFEVETYAWNVLPQELQVQNLADGIARELEWVKSTVTQCIE